jgi:hypothetical protein
MKTRGTMVNTIAFLTFPTILMAAQMQMPASTPEASMPTEGSRKEPTKWAVGAIEPGCVQPRQTESQSNA